MTDQDPSTDFYRLLKVPSTATEDEIRDALRLRRRHFTNRANNAADPVVRLEAQQTVKQLLLAERTLTDPDERRRYDALHSFGGGGQGGGSSFSPVPAYSPFPPNPPEGRPVPPPIQPVPPPVAPVAPPVAPVAPPISPVAPPVPRGDQRDGPGSPRVPPASRQPGSSPRPPLSRRRVAFGWVFAVLAVSSALTLRNNQGWALGEALDVIGAVVFGAGAVWAFGWRRRIR